MDTKTNASGLEVAGIALAALAMSVGWGFRGDYGHEAGAMVPGALLGLSICLASGRQDWWERSTIMAMCGAIGWAFGGQMSYGRVIGYTASSSLPDVAYGYASLFLIGGLWAGIGSAILALSVTESRSYLERFAGPLVALWLVWFAMDLSGLTAWMAGTWYLNDTDWFAALPALLVAGVYAAIVPRSRPACIFIMFLAGGWWAGYIILTGLLGLHMTPPRSDNWSGCVGLFIALVFYLARRQNRAALTVTLCGFLTGGIGFAVGDFVNMLGRAQWGPIGYVNALHELDYWKWMEQLFGMIMGLGAGLVFLRWMRRKLIPPAEDQSSRSLNTVGLLFLLLVMMWSNLCKNVRNWAKGDHIGDHFFGIRTEWWFLLVGLMLSAMVLVAIIRYRRGKLPLAPSSAFGRGQLLFLIILWVAIAGAFTQAFPGMARKGTFFVHTTFWITGGICSLLVLGLSGRPACQPEPQLAASGHFWRPGIRHWISWLLVPHRMNERSSAEMKENEHDTFQAIDFTDITASSLSRREFLKYLGGGIIVFFWAGSPSALQAQRRRRGSPEDFNAYLRIGDDGRITCFTGKIEMGQGIVTSLPQMLADEMDAGLESVDMVMGDTSVCPWDMGTFGSMTTRFFGPALRAAAAEARAVLIELAAEHLQAPANRLATRNGTVFDKNQKQKRVTYAQLAKGKAIARRVKEKPALKTSSQFNIVGKDVLRADASDKVTGKARYAGDIRLPDMLYARILRPPAHGAKLTSVDTSAVEKLNGVRVVRDGNLVAVLHRNPLSLSICSRTPRQRMLPTVRATSRAERNLPTL
jgi:hypothetical protein